MPYGTRDAARLTALTPSRVRALVRDGWVTVRRDARGAIRYDVAAIARLKRADALTRQVPARRLRAALARLNGPPDLDRLDVIGGELVVRDGGAAWEPRTGQVALSFDTPVGPPDALPSLAPMPVHQEDWSADDWFDLGCDLDGYDDAKAADAYRHALALAPGLVDAKVQLARIVSDQGDRASASALLEDALIDDPGHPVAWFDLGTLRAAQGDPTGALAAFLEALESDAYLADAHLSAAVVCEILGRAEDAKEHRAAYERLTGS